MIASVPTTPKGLVALPSVERARSGYGHGFQQVVS